MPDPYNTYITLNVPSRLFKDFLDLLDSAQCQYTEEDLHYMSPNQAELITYISHIVGEGATPRLKNIKSFQKALKHYGKEYQRR
jgi:hypothetical protein